MCAIKKWKLKASTRGIIDSVALEYDGYRIRNYLYSKQKSSVCLDERFRNDFRLHEDRYFLRSELFGLQRYFGKWGGEMVEEWDRQYSQYYFVYLQSYRAMIPSLMTASWSRTFSKGAQKRECAAADLRLAFSKLGEDDLRTWSSGTLESELKYGFDKVCGARIPLKVANRPEVVLANSCNADLLLRLTNSEFSPDTELSCLNTAPAMTAFEKYCSHGYVDLDDNINRLVFKMLQWYFSAHPDKANFQYRSYILFALMYLHLYRTAFSRFAGLPENLKEWQGIPLSVREARAADFRRHLSEARENAARR